MAKRAPLGVWLYGGRVAELTSGRPGQVVCRYSGEALERWPLNIPLLSCSLLLSARPRRDAGVFFRGMLPEGQHLQAMATEANVATYDTFGLLARFGRDVAGAAVIAGTSAGERPGGVVPYSDEALDREVAGLEDRPLAIYDDSELSIAGLQNKMLLVADGTTWARPVGGHPSTHILKVEDRRYPGMVTMEASCLALARAVGLTSVEAEVRRLGGADCIIVSRYDRKVGPEGKATRLHQEDACQALGRDPEAVHGQGKYQHAGGPALAEIARLLDLYATDPIEELKHLVSAVTFNVCTGNADAHGKNVSFLYEKPGQLRLAPLYDTVPTALWPRLRTRAAMTINGQAELGGVMRADVVAEARRWPLAPDVAQAVATTTAEGVLSALDATAVPAQLADFVRHRVTAFLA